MNTETKPIRPTQAWAIPGAHSVIAEVHPITGRSTYSNLTEAEVIEQNPGAVVMSWEDWRKARAAQQHAPITWSRTTEDEYDRMLNVLPPAFWRGGLFLVGEPYDHSAYNGAPLFSAYWKRASGTCFVASRPITRAEAQTEINGACMLILETQERPQ